MKLARSTFYYRSHRDIAEKLKLRDHSRQQNRFVDDFAGLTDFYLSEQCAGVLRMHPNAPAALKVIDREQRIRAVDSVRWKA